MSEHDQKLAEEFDKVALERGEGMALGHAEFVEAAISHWQIDENSKILDIGCGVGLALETIHKKFLTSEEQLAGIDLSLEMISQAKHRLPLSDLHRGACETLPWPDNTFTHVISIESLFFHKNPSLSLTEILRVMKPGARFDNVMEFFQENEGSRAWADGIDVNLHLHTSDQWKNMMTKAGFQHVFHDIILRTDLENPKPESEFKASDFTPSYEHYLKTLEGGALWLKGEK